MDQVLLYSGGLGWLLLMLGPLLVLQRALHRQLQGVFLILTRRPAVAMGIFSFIFLPGVALHEGSHYLMARLLGVHTGRVSLLPRPTRTGMLQLGFVETAHTDVVRDALIGAAPLITGGMVVAYIGVTRMKLLPPGERLIARINTQPFILDQGDDATPMGSDTTRQDCQDERGNLSGQHRVSSIGDDDISARQDRAP